MKRPLQDRMARAFVRGLGNLPTSVQRILGGNPISIDGQVLSAETQMGRRLLQRTVTETFETLPLHEGRAQIEAEAWIFGKETPVETVRDLVIPGPAGLLPARLYRPAGAEAGSPALVYFHGGGWVLGDLTAADSVARFLAVNAGVTVISIDYRLAPEHPFPAAVDDALAAFDHVVSHADQWGIDPSTVAVGGESAGGNLAAVVSQLAADRAKAAPDAPTPAFQLLLMPVTDLSRKHPSYDLFGEGFFLTAAQMDWYKDHYLADPEHASDPRVSPLLADDVSGVAPAYVAVAGFDPLRDEGEAYAAKLAAAGVPTTLRRFAETSHSSINAVGVGRAAREMLLEVSATLRVAVAPGVARVPGRAPASQSARRRSTEATVS